MKKFIKKILLFVPAAVVVYFVLLIAIGELAPHWLYTNLKYTRGYSDTQTRITEAKHIHRPDILVIGSSHAYRGFDPRIFATEGYTLFNLGSSSQTPLQSSVLLKRYLKKIQPGLILYEVYPGTFASDGAEGAADIISNDTIDNLIPEMVTKVNDIVAYNTLAFGWYKQLTTTNKTTVLPKLHKADTYIKGGYVEKQLAYYTPQKNYKPIRWKLKQKQFKAFAENIAYIKELGIPYVLVNAPIPSWFYNSHTNNKTFDGRMAEFGTYYNYNEKLPLNDSLHFFDNNHLNQKGVALFNAALLSDRRIFPKK